MNSAMVWPRERSPLSRHRLKYENGLLTSESLSGP
jgi:hypothetical protein